MLRNKLLWGWCYVVLGIEISERQADCLSVQVVEGVLIWGSRNITELILTYWLGWCSSQTVCTLRMWNESHAPVWNRITISRLSIPQPSRLSRFPDTFAHSSRATMVHHKYGFSTKTYIFRAQSLLTLLLSVIMTSNLKCFDVYSN